jgi:hypothetical protein
MGSMLMIEAAVEIVVPVRASDDGLRLQGVPHLVEVGYIKSVDLEAQSMIMNAFRLHHREGNRRGYRQWP